jgi:hypothetical protein
MAADAERLDDGDEAADEEIGGNQERDVLRAELQARPTMSGTATAPPYMTSTCCMPSVASLPAGSFSSTGCMLDASLMDSPPITSTVSARPPTGWAIFRVGSGGRKHSHAINSLRIREVIIRPDPGHRCAAGTAGI